MSAQPLPTTLDVRKAAVREAEITGYLRPSDLPRFRTLLAGYEGEINVDLRFSRDEESRYLVNLAVVANVEVTCQRCLEAMPRQLSCQSELAVVWTDEQAAELPRYLDPLIVAEQSCDLAEVVEDELILAMPPYSYHETEDCKKLTEAYSDPVEETESEKPNPFEVLAQLKPGNEQ